MSLVTILILIDGFLQYGKPFVRNLLSLSHNPYFNRWFSAIKVVEIANEVDFCHNPYFNRWFSAMSPLGIVHHAVKVTILILIDGFLQYNILDTKSYLQGSQSLF